MPSATFSEDPALEAGHGEELVGVVLGVDGDEGVVPGDGGDGAGQPVLDVPEDGPAQVDVVLHEAHARVARPAPLVVVPHDVLVVRVGVLGQVALDQVARLLGGEPAVVGVLVLAYCSGILFGGNIFGFGP